MSKKLSREYIERVSGKRGRSVSSNGNGGGGSGGGGYVTHAKSADEVPWTGVQDVITDGNEFNILDDVPTSGHLWINYKDREGNNLSSPVTQIKLGNGQGSGSGVTLVVDKISIGGIVIEWDSSKSALKVNGSLLATGTVGSIT